MKSCDCFSALSPSSAKMRVASVLPFTFRRSSSRKAKSGARAVVDLADHGADVVGLGLAFEPRGDIDVVADHRIVEARLRAEIADAAHAGVEPDAELHRLERRPLASASWRQRSFESRISCHHAQCRAAGMARMVAVVERRVPERHHRIAHEFVDGALLLEDDVAQRREQAVQEAGQLLGVETFRDAW